MSEIKIHTSVDDLYGQFKCSIKHHSVKDFENAIAQEQATQNRISVIRILQRAMRAKKEMKEKI